MAITGTTINASIPNGQTENFIARTDDANAVRVDLSADGEPYDVNVKTRGAVPDPANVTPADWNAALARGAETVKDTDTHEIGTTTVDAWVLVSVTNDSGGTATMDGAINRNSRDSPQSAQSFARGSADATGLSFYDGRADNNIRRMANQVIVQSASDLPGVTNGRHQLADGTVYRFAGFVASASGLELASSSPLVGMHGGTDGFICTGGGPAVYGRDANYLQRDIYLHAPGGTVFDLQATQEEEFLVESVSHSDAAGLGNAADWGTIDGFRVPTFKGANFEETGTGVTFTGTPDKIFVSGCPFRNITASNVTLMEFDADLTTDIVDMPDNYIKEMQADTVVIDVDPSATINDIFQYRGTVHDSTVTESNILTGAAGVDVVGYRVSNAYPLRDSTVVGELSLDSQTTTTISDQDTYTPVEGATTLGNETARVSQPNNGTLQYDGQKGTYAQITASITMQVPANETAAAAIAKNGSVEPTSEARVEGSGNAPVTAFVTSVEDVTSGEDVAVHIKNIDSTQNITVDLYNLNMIGA